MPKITPLNIVSALGIMLAVLLLFNNKLVIKQGDLSYRGLLIAFCLLMVFIAFLADQVFRKLVPSLSKIWLLELALIVLTVILLIILKISIVN
jgi:hypothetical protein